MDEKTPIGSLRTCLSVLANDTRGQMSELERIPLYAALSAAICELEQLRLAAFNHQLLAMASSQLLAERSKFCDSLKTIERMAKRQNFAERLCLRLYERLNYLAAEPWLPDPSGRSIPGEADWARWDEWNKRDPGGVTADEQKAIEAMRGRQKT